MTFVDFNLERECELGQGLSLNPFESAVGRPVISESAGPLPVRANQCIKERFADKFSVLLVNINSAILSNNARFFVELKEDDVVGINQG